MVETTKRPAIATDAETTNTEATFLPILITMILSYPTLTSCG
jgi:hypothetical protein